MELRNMIKKRGRERRKNVQFRFFSSLSLFSLLIPPLSSVGLSQKCNYAYLQYIALLQYLALPSRPYYTSPLFHARTLAPPLSFLLQAYDQHLNMVLSEVEETVTTVEVDEETCEEVIKV
jgi:hypothetical protein